MAVDNRPVTEMDFRLPQFRDAKAEDYEFNAAGEIVRKDRWETGFRRIVGLIQSVRDPFEIDEVIKKVSDALKRLPPLDASEWHPIADMDKEDADTFYRVFDVQLADGSIINNCQYVYHSDRWNTMIGEFVNMLPVVAFRISSANVDSADKLWHSMVSMPRNKTIAAACWHQHTWLTALAYVNDEGVLAFKSHFVTAAGAVCVDHLEPVAWGDCSLHHNRTT